LKPLLTIVIPSLDNLQQLYWCTRSLLQYTDYPYQITVVDNGNEPRIEHMFQEVWRDKITVLRPGKNLGWMGAHNLAIKDCDTKYYCCLNDDTVFLPGQPIFWRSLVDTFKDKGVGAVAPCSNFVAGCQSLMNLDVPHAVETTLVIGMCLVFPTKLIRELGGWDESLPGGDDLDISIRMLKAGYKLRVNRFVYLHHLGQQTGRRLFGDDWDSLDHQEATNNALIRKHGLKAWNETFQAKWRHLKEDLKTYDHGSSDDVWIDKHLEKYKGNGAVGVNLGCGNQKTKEDLKCFGLDQNTPGKTGVGGMRFSGAQPDVVGKAEQLPYQDHSVDYIAAKHLFEHVVDPVSVLDEWKRVLKPDGRLYMIVPNHNEMPTMLVDCSHTHCYTEDSLPRLLKTAGWSVKSLESGNWQSIRLVATKV